MAYLVNLKVWSLFEKFESFEREFILLSCEKSYGKLNNLINFCCAIIVPFAFSF